MSTIKKTKKDETPAIIKEIRAKIAACVVDDDAAAKDLSAYLSVRNPATWGVYHSNDDRDEHYDYGQDVDFFIPKHYTDIIMLEVALDSFDAPTLGRYGFNLHYFYQFKRAFYFRYIKEVEAFIEIHGEWDQALYMFGARQKKKRKTRI